MQRLYHKKRLRIKLHNPSKNMYMAYTSGVHAFNANETKRNCTDGNPCCFSHPLLPFRCRVFMALWWSIVSQSSRCLVSRRVIGFEIRVQWRWPKVLYNHGPQPLQASGLQTAPRVIRVLHHLLHLAGKVSMQRFEGAFLCRCVVSAALSSSKAAGTTHGWRCGSSKIRWHRIVFWKRPIVQGAFHPRKMILRPWIIQRDTVFASETAIDLRFRIYEWVNRTIVSNWWLK